ncbi:capsular polysaccharide biosynthesis protein Cps4H [Bifidobacterium dolichotidis]|uniref:Capsular polysaccharide biosynthesis protein Cps4H n=2 Tax=Bifidobacterium dolichotidis TaxID=2306976 RepID=A0A430FRP0_9BIFI|nr:capsular polysaccharide biosynthesis protein Cps4H [Bifidobacterium dolichotidis]
MKRVLVFGMSGNRGGIEAFLMNTYSLIDRSRLQFDFIANEPQISYEDEINEYGGRIYHIPKRSQDPITYKRALENIFKEHSSEYAGIWANLVSLANIDYLIEAYKHGIPKRVVHCHNAKNMDGKIRGALHVLNRSRIQKYATDFWTCSDKASEWFYGKKIMEYDSYRLINNSVDSKKYLFNKEKRETLRNQFGIGSDEIVLGNVGRFHPQKNHHFLIDVYRAYVDKVPNSRLLLIGKGDDRPAIEQHIRQAGVEDKVLILGERKDVADLYQAMDVFVFPSRYEGMSIALLEAQASGLPSVISTGNPPESKINSNVQRLPLEENKNVSDWVAALLRASSMKRLDQKENNLIGSEYDTNMQGAYIQEFFLS